ncbi:MAG: amidase family protein [Acidimicrobiia bacterium]
MDQATATWTASRLAAAIRARQLSSRDLLELYIDRIERLTPPLNAVVTLDLERARAEAARADEEAERGEWRGPLHGLPTTIKDAIEVGGVRSTGGATELTDHVPTADAPSVARLKEAGAIVFGKTNAPRWSGDVQTFNDIFGTTNNPWDLERVPGGSSGGAAAAVAAGFTSFELGTDIGGSVRSPSHCCGVFGLKPSFGVVSQRGYLDHVGGGTTDADINVFGPIARSAEDLDLLIDVLAGPDADRALAWRLELPAPRQAEVGDFRVGVWLEDPATQIDREVLTLLQNAADALSDAGAKVEDAHPNVSFAEQRNLFVQLIISAISPSMAYDPTVEDAGAASGAHLSWLQADEARARLRAIWADWFRDYDALLCPVLPVPAFPHDHTADFMTRTLTINGEQQPYPVVTDWTGLIGIVGLPSAVAPVGRTPAGLPVGIQVVAPYLRDRESVRLAGIVADVSGGGYQPPPGF